MMSMARVLCGAALVAACTVASADPHAHLEKLLKGQSSVDSQLILTLGFNVCLDQIVPATAVLPALQLKTPVTRGVDHAVVGDDAQLAEVFLFHMAAGAAGERIVTDEGLWARLLAAAQAPAAESRSFIGGNAALMAQQAAALCPSCDVLLAGAVGPGLKQHLSPDILLLEEAEGDEVHLILEYPEGLQWGGATAPRANRFILTADAGNANPVAPMITYSHLRGTGHADLLQVQSVAVGDGLPNMYRLEEAMSAAKTALAKGKAEGEEGKDVTAADSTGTVSVTLSPDGTVLDSPMMRLPYHDVATSSPLPPHYFTTVNLLDQVHPHTFDSHSIFRASMSLHGHLHPDVHYAHGHVRDGDGLPTPAHVLVIAGLHMYEALPSSEWESALAAAFIGVHTLPGFPLLHVELASMAQPHYISMVARATGTTAHSMGLNEQELATVYEALGGAYVDEAADMPSIQAFVQARQADVREALLGSDASLDKDAACGEAGLDCSSTAALHAYVQGDRFNESAPHPFTVHPQELTTALVQDALGLPGVAVAHVATRSALTRVVPDPTAVAAALRFVLAHSHALCRVHFHSLAFHIMVQRRCTVPQEVRTWSLSAPAPAVAAGAAAVALKACGVQSPAQLSSDSLKVLAPLQLEGADPVLSTLGQEHEGNPVAVGEDGTASWTWPDLRRYHFSPHALFEDEHTAFRPVTFAYAPVPVCKQPRATVGLGDAISATGLAAHVRPFGPGSSFPRPTKHSVGHPGSSGGKMGVPAPPSPPREEPKDDKEEAA